MNVLVLRVFAGLPDEGPSTLPRAIILYLKHPNWGMHYMERPVRAGYSYGIKRQNMHNPERMFIQRQDGLVDRVHVKLQLGGTRLKERGKKVMRIQCRCKCQCQCVGVRSNDESAESV